MTIWWIVTDTENLVECSECVRRFDILKSDRLASCNLQSPKSIYVESKNNSFIYVSAAAAFVILLVVLTFSNPEFGSYRVSDKFAPYWYFITSTASIPSVAIILVLTFIFLKYHFRKFSKNQRGAYIFFCLIVAFQISIAVFTRYILKNVFQEPRPAQQYFASDETVSGENEIFEMAQDSAEMSMKNIYPPIAEEWKSASAYSFPSGHASSSFYLAVILSFIIYRTVKNRIWSLIPFVWAIQVCLSRVIIGMHFPADVLAGAIVGAVAALVLITFRQKLLFNVDRNP